MAIEKSAQESSKASPQLLRKIDKLRERNIGQHVLLPQVHIFIDTSDVYLEVSVKNFDRKDSLTLHLARCGWRKIRRRYPSHGTSSFVFAMQLRSLCDVTQKVKFSWWLFQGLVQPTNIGDDWRNIALKACLHLTSDLDPRAYWMRYVLMGNECDLSFTGETVFSEDILDIEISGFVLSW